MAASRSKFPIHSRREAGKYIEVYEEPGTIGFLPSHWALKALAFIAISLVLAWQNRPVREVYDVLMEFTGLGLVLAGVWLLLLARSIVYHPSRTIEGWNRWLGSLLFVAVALGTLAFFSAAEGVLSKETLGGRVGSAITGESQGYGAARVSALLAAATWITFPSFSMKAANSLRNSLVTSYVFALMTARWSATASVFLYRRLRMDLWLLGLPRLSARAGGWAATRVIGVVWKHRRPAMGVADPSYRDELDSKLTPLDDLLKDLYPADRSVSLVRGPRVWSKPTPLDELLSGLTPSRSEASIAYGPGLDAPSVALEETSPEEEALESDEEAPNGVSAPQEENVGWEMPSLYMLDTVQEEPAFAEENQKTAELITNTLAEYGIEVTVDQIRPGPTVTQFGLVPGWVRRYKETRPRDEFGKLLLDEIGRPRISQVENKTRVKVDSILAREKDLALALATPNIRIEAPVPGESLVGIEVPNSRPTLVTQRSVMESHQFQEMRAKSRLAIALGKGSGGESVVADLTRMPHLLIAGATGSGKSVCINALITCLIMSNSPAELRLLLVDPKRVELTPFNGIPHLLYPVVVEADRVVPLLKGVINEMLRRYRLFERASVRNIEAYNQAMPEKMPYIVVAVDELADIMMTAPSDIEASLCRLAQLGRATGIHLVVATQRPSVDVLTGLIKANFPSRISFAVTSYVDSRTILDSGGAEKLLGRGDMLYQPVDAPKPRRIQGAYIGDRETQRVVNYWRGAIVPATPAIQLEEQDDPFSENEQTADRPAERDELIEKAIEVARSYRRVSISLLQRRLRIGYPKAARLIEALESEGIVGPGVGSDSREVLAS